jgi:PAS domain S-box-containing protein
MGVQKYDIPVRDDPGRFEVKYWSPVNTPVMCADGEIDFIIHRVEDVTEFVLMRERAVAADADRMEAEVLRGGVQIKAANRDLKHSLEQLTEANAKLKDHDRLQAEQLDVAISAAQLGLWALDLRTNMLTTSEVCRRDYGWLSPEPFTLEALLGLIHPEDRPRRDRMVAEAFATGRDLQIDYRVIRPDGETVWMHVRGRAEYDPDGTPIGAIGVSADVTARKLAEERQNRLIAELNHRVKNTLASVQSIALQTGLTTHSPEEFLAAFDGRMRALVGAHDLLTSNAWQAASLEDVVRRTLAPYAARDGVGNRLAVEGPSIRFHPETAVTLHMAMHELATNAAKYGALSTPAGSVAVTWTVDRSTDPATVEIVWREQGGPPVVAPTRRGFGTNLLERGLARELGGSVTMAFALEGLVCVMRFAMSDKLAA